jgi:hypothetical protein
MVMRSREEEEEEEEEEEPPAAMASKFPPRCHLAADHEEMAACRNAWEWEAAMGVAWDTRGCVAEEERKAEQRVAACRKKRVTKDRGVLHIDGRQGRLLEGDEGHRRWALENHRRGEVDTLVKETTTSRRGRVLTCAWYCDGR